MGEQLGHHPLGGIGRDGKPDTLGHHDDGGVDPYHPAPGIHQRPPGVAGVKGRRVLDDVLDEAAGLATQGPAQGAHHSGGDGGLEAEGVADGDDELAHPQGGGIPQSGKRQTRGVHPDHRQVGGGVGADDVGRQGAAILEGGLEKFGVSHHVVVGEDVAVRGDDDPGAGPGLLRRGPLRLHPDTDAHYRGTHLLHHLDDGSGVSVQQFQVRRREAGRAAAMSPGGQILSADEFQSASHAFFHEKLRYR